MNERARPFAANTVLKPAEADPQVPPSSTSLLVLRPRRPEGGWVAVMWLGRGYRHPFWASEEDLESQVRAGTLVAAPHEPPAAAFTLLEDLTPGAKKNYEARRAAFEPFIGDERVAFLEDPDLFSRVCAEYANEHGLNRRWVEKMACSFLKNGRTLAAVVSDLGNCGAKGKPRDYKDDVPGPSQGNGAEYSSIAAKPFLREEREWLQAQASKLYHKEGGKSLTEDEFWWALVEKVRIERPDLPMLAPSQATRFFKQLKAISRAQIRRGLVGSRHSAVSYSSQESEADSSELQLFTQSELVVNAKLKNPTYYLHIDVKWKVIGAVYVSYEAPSNALMAELLLRGILGMANICKEYGLPWDETVFPPLPLGERLRVDHQELTSPVMDDALLKHLGTKVELALLETGDDKGSVEGSIGHTKRKLKRRRDWFGKKAISRVISRARDRANSTLRQLEEDLIALAAEWNLKHLPAKRIPPEFLKTGRPTTRVELYRWDLERHREVVKTVPSEAALSSILLPTKLCKVHAGEGIYLDGLYYSCDELVTSGLLKPRARGKQPVVKVKEHRGTRKFILWVRGVHDEVRCYLRSPEQAVMADMSKAEAKAHLGSLPSARKRNQLARVLSNAQSGVSTTPREWRRQSEAAQRGHRTRQENRLEVLKELKTKESNLNAKRDARRRFPEHVPEPSAAAHQETALPHLPDYAEQMAARVASKLNERAGAQPASKNEE